MRGDGGKCGEMGEMRGDWEGCGEMRTDAVRCGEMRGDRLLGEAVQLEHEGLLLGLQLLHEPLVVLVEDLDVALHHALHLRGQRPGGARQLEVKVVDGEAEAVEQA